MRILLFDIDGTLISTGGAGVASLYETLREDFGVTAPAEGVEFAGRTDRVIVRDLLVGSGLEDTDAHAAKFIEGYLSRLRRHLANRPGCVLPGVADLLDEAAGRVGIHLGLLTGNVARGARIKLEHYGLMHHFHFGGFGDRHFDRDLIARDALAEVRRRLGDAVAAEDVWVIGDTPHDVRCGKAIGARTLGVATGKHTVAELQAADADAVVADLADTPRIARLLCDGAA